MRKRTIAPRLASGDPRVRFALNLPDAVKEGLRRIARMENKSMSWALEEVVYDYFHLKRPKFKERN